MYKIETGGAKPIAIAGRTTLERERLIGMSEEERSWRKQWLKDQILSPNEPRHVPEIYKAQFNIIRRIYRTPLDIAEKLLQPALGSRVKGFRIITGKFFLMYLVGLTAFYNLKYNENDWTRLGGFRLLHSRSSVLPGDPCYPQPSHKTQPSEYSARQFDKVQVKL